MLAYFLFAACWWIWTLVKIKRLNCGALGLLFLFGFANALMFGSYDAQKLVECYYSLPASVLKEMRIENELAPAGVGSLVAALGVVIALWVLRSLHDCNGANLSN